MKEQEKQNATSPCYYGDIGNFGSDAQQPASERKYTIFQSLWTKPFDNKDRLRDTLYIAALSLYFAHRSGYKVHMHTDTKGAALLKNFGYEKLLTTLNEIPDTVPTDLFAAGKFFAMKAEGVTGKIHIDVDVFIKKAGLLDVFYTDKNVDAICQQEEDFERVCNHDDKIRPMHILGYPATSRPNWRGSMNVGVIGFNNPVLGNKYVDNYFEALKIYTVEKFKKYKEEDKDACLWLDFILEQVNLSYMSLGHNVVVLLPTNNPGYVANKIGYQHMQGSGKWTSVKQQQIKDTLIKLDGRLLRAANEAVRKISLK